MLCETLEALPAPDGIQVTIVKTVREEGGETPLRGVCCVGIDMCTRVNTLLHPIPPRPRIRTFNLVNNNRSMIKTIQSV